MSSSTQQASPKAVALAESATISHPIIWPLGLRAISMRPAYLEPSGWFEHIPFAFWLIEAHHPCQFVELGTHWGTSYFAFCQAIERLGLDTRCFAVDTWKGDEHAGFYGSEVFERVQDHNELQYSGFSRLVRSTFDDALKHFSDGTIDLLHIDGLHSLEAVRHDFESWLPKLSERGLVVMHDTNVRERNFGVYKLFEELCGHYPFFEFLHGNGLGVLGIGAEQNENLRRLFQAQFDDGARRMLHEVFGRLGRACADAFIAQRQQAKQLELEHTAGKQKKDIEDLQKVQREQKEELRRLKVQRNESDAALKKREVELERLRKSEQESQRQIAGLKKERHRLQLENEKLSSNIQTRFDELAKLTKMLLKAEEATRCLEERATKGEARIESLVGEIARLDRVTERTSSTKPDDGRNEIGGSETEPVVRSFEILSVGDKPAVMELADVKREVFVELTLFGEIDGKPRAARLVAEALDGDGKVLAGTFWRKGNRGAATSESRIRRLVQRLWRPSRSPGARVLTSSREGEVFAERVILPHGATCLRLTCERLTKGSRLWLVRGNTVLVDRRVEPKAGLGLRFRVCAKRPLRRAVMLVPEYFDRTGKLLPPSYDGFQSDEKGVTFVHLGSAPNGRRTSIQAKVPVGAVRLRLHVRPALARGLVEIAEVEPLRPVFSFTRVPRKGKINVSLTLLGPYQDPQAAVLIPTYFGDSGEPIQGAFQGFESSEEFPAFRYLPASPFGTTADIALAVPPGVERCKLDVLPWKLRVGLRVEAGNPAKEAVHIDGALLPEEGVGLQCEIGPGAILWFKLRVTGARDVKDAGICAIKYFSAAHELVPLPYPGLQENEELGGVLLFRASSKPQGHVNIIRLPCPQGATKAQLRFLPKVAEDALRVRIEPMRNRRSLVKASR